MTAAATAAPYAFVSYASADRERVLPAVAALRAAGVAVWIDQAGIAAGTNYAAEIADAIKGAAVVLLMASPAALASRNVKQEVALAWRYERPCVPLRLDPVTIPDDLAYWLEAAQWLDVLDLPPSAWLPPLLAALAPHGIAPALPPASHERLTGRGREQGLLREYLGAAREGHGNVVLIGGEAGVGKTTLADALCREADTQGCVVLTGRSYDLAETPPYGPWVDLFAHLPAGRVLPPLPDAFATPGTVGAVASQAALFQQLLAFLRATAAQQPAVLLLDDLHWADAASLDVLRAVAREAATLRLLLLVTYRSDELTRRHPLYALLPVLEREAQATRLDLRRFAADDVRALLDRRYALPDADTARLVAWLQGRAEGNAFFTAQLLRALEDAGVLHQADGGWALGDLSAVGLPAPLRQVLDGRLARLGEEAQRLLTLAAVIGAEVPLALWATVAETDEDGLLDTIERAVNARLLTEVPDGSAVRFAHALIREALYEGLLATRRRRVHRTVAEALAATASPDPDAVAYHLRQTGDPRAADWLIAAGERAHRAYAWLTAADRYEAALAIMEAHGADTGRRIELLITLAQLRRYGDTWQSVALMEAAARLAEGLGDAAQVASARFEAGHIRCIAGAESAGLAAMAAALPTLEALSPAERARLPALRILGVAPDELYHRGALVMWLADFGHHAEAWAYAAPFRSGGPGVTARALTGLGRVHAMRGRPAEARQSFIAACAIYQASRQHGQVGGSFKGELLYVLLPYEADRVAERRRVADEAVSAAMRGRDVIRDVPPRSLILDLLVLEGAWDEARAVAQAARTSAYVVARMEAASALASMARDRGDRDQAWVAVRELFPAGPATEPGATHFRSALATFPQALGLALDEGDLDTARRWLDCHNRWLGWSGGGLGLSEAQCGWAVYHRAAADLDQARQHAARALEHASDPRQPLALLAAHRLLGELDTAEGHHAGAADHLAAALALAGACAAPYERALTLLALAELRAATGDREDALAALYEVRAICTPLGARPALDRAAALEASLAARG